MNATPDAIAALRAAPVPPSGPRTGDYIEAWIAAYERWWRDVRGKALAEAGEGT